METDFRDLTYLLKGTERQKQAFCALRDSRIMEILRDYSPFLAGAIPLGVDVETSDLDIVCEVYDQEKFYQYLVQTLKHYDPLSLIFKIADAVPCVLVNFSYYEIPIQVIGKPLPIVYQSPYRNLMIFARLLKIGGERLRHGVLELRKTGLKTEPAFADYLKLEGEPYRRLWDLEAKTEKELQAIVAKVQEI